MRMEPDETYRGGADWALTYLGEARYVLRHWPDGPDGAVVERELDGSEGSLLRDWGRTFFPRWLARRQRIEREGQPQERGRRIAIGDGWWFVEELPTGVCEMHLRTGEIFERQVIADLTPSEVEEVIAGDGQRVAWRVLHGPDHPRAQPRRAEG